MSNKYKVRDQNIECSLRHTERDRRMRKKAKKKRREKCVKIFDEDKCRESEIKKEKIDK